MSWSSHRSVATVLLLVAMLCCCGPLVAQQTRAATTAPSRNGAGNDAYGPDVVVMDELVERYEAVPFEHRVHAEMAEMWDGCETCHHHTPKTSDDGAKADDPQAEKKIPACKSCHSVEPANANIEMPSLKGAYHRQCLNCHREWMGANACVICHATREDAATRPAGTPSPDDITGRMHKPLTPPSVLTIQARYTPVDGRNVILRHDQHAEQFGIKCVACHRRDSCGDCHASESAAAADDGSGATTSPSRILKPSMTWRESHQPCISCHEQDKCGHCHYQSGEEPPPAFRHEMTGQQLDRHHEKLACGECHEHYKSPPPANCASAECHHQPKTFPKDRPGRYTPPVATVAEERSTANAADSKPTTRPMVIRIRRGEEQ